MTTFNIDPFDPQVLARNYDYAQKNVRLLAMWYECDVEQMVKLLVEHDIDLSRNDRMQFDVDYQSVQLDLHR